MDPSCCTTIANVLYMTATLTYQRKVILRVHELTSWTNRWYLLIRSPVNLRQDRCHGDRSCGPTRTNYYGISRRATGGLLLVGWKYGFRGSTYGRGCGDGGRLNGTSYRATSWLRLNGEAQRTFKNSAVNKGTIHVMILCKINSSYMTLIGVHKGMVECTPITTDLFVHDTCAHIHTCIHCIQTVMQTVLTIAPPGKSGLGGIDL